MLPPEAPSSTLHVTVPPPLTVAVNVCIEPAGTLTGDGLIITSGNTVKLAVAEPPPGPGFVTTTGNVPTVARSKADRLIVNWLALTNVAEWFTPLKVTAEEGTNPKPLMVSDCGVASTAREAGTTGAVMV